MKMTIEDLRDILDGFVTADLGDCPVDITAHDRDIRKAVSIDSATIYKNGKGELVPKFNGWIQDGV